MRRKRSPSRKSATKTPAARTIIVTEGERTEPEYLKTFVRIQGVKTAVVIGVGGDPRAVVERAMSERSKLRKDSLGRYDTVWAMFDRDEHPRFAEAKNLAEEHGVQLAVSNPCFELWGVFHYRDWDAHVDRRECQRLLTQNCPIYSARAGKLFNDEKVIRENYSAAVQRGKDSLIRREKEGDPHGNPSTSVHCLTECIINARLP